jgi:phosphate transport system permease protein
MQTAPGRVLRDRLATLVINSAGLGVAGLLLLMLWYLFSVALPLAEPLQVGDVRQLPAGLAAPGNTLRHTDDGGLEVAAASGSGAWVLYPGAYRCAGGGERRRIDGPWRAEPRVATTAESGSVLLVVDGEGALHRPGDQRRPLHAAAPRRGAFTALCPDLAAGGAAPGDRVPPRRRGRLRVIATTTGAVLFDGRLPGAEGVVRYALADAGSALLGWSGARVLHWDIRNRFPEAGWRSLWTAQHHSGYAQAEHVWHPGDGGTGALAKYALAPLLLGTFKAALYGMLIAVPLAIGAAIYTGYFLSQRQRNRIKPVIELLEAIPTVVLGFLAGLWLAPLLAEYLLWVFLLPLLLVGLPLLFALLHVLGQRLSPRLVLRPPRATLLLAAYAAVLLLLVALGPYLESLLFGGAVRDWLQDVAGIDYRQRNALLIGFAMGVSLLPTLFSIVEDAVFAVPRSLSDGSLALGATRWQSLSRVVLPAASPALLSALLIGLARGLGETMIVLLATGNTPLMDMGPFTGMRSLAATLAIELPEVAVGGVHFRILFLAALLLFAFTFVLNTIAEIFRMRLRYRYAGR